VVSFSKATLQLLPTNSFISRGKSHKQRCNVLCFVTDVLFIGGDRTFDSDSNTRSHMLIEALPFSDTVHALFPYFDRHRFPLKANARAILNSVSIAYALPQKGG
jgi:hypothetical protein